MLELTPNKGPVVPNLDYREAANAYVVRGELEGLACALCAERATEQDLAELTRCLDAMTGALANTDFTILQHAKTEFYDRLYNAAGNPELKLILQRLRARVTLCRGLNVNRTARVQESLDGARSILAALIKRDPVASRRAAEQHIAKASKLALEAMSQAAGVEHTEEFA